MIIRLDERVVMPYPRFVLGITGEKDQTLIQAHPREGKLYVCGIAFPHPGSPDCRFSVLHPRTSEPILSNVRAKDLRAKAGPLEPPFYPISCQHADGDPEPMFFTKEEPIRIARAGVTDVPFLLVLFCTDSFHLAPSDCLVAWRPN